MVFKVERYEEALIIDRDDLDEAVCTQAELFYHVARETALAVSRRDAAYQEQKVVAAELSQSIRAEKEANDEKVTEALLTNLVISHPKNKKAVARQLELKLAADELEALKQAFEQRSHALKDAAQLQIARMYSDPSVREEKTTQAIMKRRSQLAEKREPKR